MTAAPGREKTDGITWAGLSTEDKRLIKESWNKWDVIGSVIVLGLVVGFYLYFSFWLG